jgi:putative tryptophan/tyrosine transport system substrate-binding protein
VPPSLGPEHEQLPPRAQLTSRTQPLGCGEICLRRQQLAELAIKHRLATIGGEREAVNAGLLAAYGPDYLSLSRRAAIFVDKILKGAKPAELPVEQPTKFELVTNLNAAKALVLTIPKSLLLRANRVIE